MRLRDHASLDPHTRGVERNRRAILTGGAATLARAVQIGTSLITVPLTLRYLGNERFGLWMTISSVLAMAAFADFGVGNGVLNTVAKAYGEDDLDGVRMAISSGFTALSSIAGVLLLSFFVVYQFGDWADFFRVVSPQARAEAGPTLAVFATCFALNISLDVVQRTQLGLQQGFRFGLWQLCGSLSGFAGVLCGIWLKVSLPLLVVAIAGAPVLATTLNAIHFFGFVRPDLRPRWQKVRRGTISQIVRLGGLFFVLQVVVGAAFSADNFIIARAIGAVNVPEYSIPQRMFALITTLSGMLVAPLWPAYSEAISRGDITWVRSALRSSLTLVASAAAAASGMLLVLSHKLLYWWVGDRVHPHFMLMLGLAIWTVISCCGDCLAMFMNGVEIIRFQIIVAPIFGAGCVIAKLFFIHRFGVSSVPWATIFSYALLSALPTAFYLNFFIRQLGNRKAKTLSGLRPKEQEGMDCV
jgi:O-antigen/teichoic acid export membrane protein